MALTSLQKWLLALALAIGLLGAFGSLWQSIWSFFFGEQTPVWRFIMSAAIDLEDWVRNKGGSPFLLALAAFIALVTFQLPALWHWIRRHRVNKDEFEEEFQNNSWNRNLVWNVFKDYLEQKKFDRNIRAILESTDLPSALPLAQQADVHEWLKSAQLDSDQQMLLEMSDELHRVNSPPNHSAYTVDRSTCSKFWDKVGRRIQDRVLKFNDVRGPIMANALAIKLQVFLELGHIKNDELGSGPGKNGLFYLAKMVQDEARK